MKLIKIHDISYVFLFDPVLEVTEVNDLDDQILVEPVLTEKGSRITMRSLYCQGYDTHREYTIFITNYNCYTNPFL